MNYLQNELALSKNEEKILAKENKKENKEKIPFLDRCSKGIHRAFDVFILVIFVLASVYFVNKYTSGLINHFLIATIGVIAVFLKVFRVIDYSWNRAIENNEDCIKLNEEHLELSKVANLNKIETTKKINKFNKNQINILKEDKYNLKLNKLEMLEATTGKEKYTKKIAKFKKKSKNKIKIKYKYYSFNELVIANTNIILKYKSKSDYTGSKVSKLKIIKRNKIISTIFSFYIGVQTIISLIADNSSWIEILIVFGISFSLLLAVASSYIITYVFNLLFAPNKYIADVSTYVFVLNSANNLNVDEV